MGMLDLRTKMSKPRGRKHRNTGKTFNGWTFGQALYLAGSKPRGRDMDQYTGPLIAFIKSPYGRRLLSRKEWTLLANFIDAHVGPQPKGRPKGAASRSDRPRDKVT